MNVLGIPEYPCDDILLMFLEDAQDCIGCKAFCVFQCLTLIVS